MAPKPPLVFVPKHQRYPNGREATYAAAAAAERASRAALTAACAKVRREMAAAGDELPNHERENILALLESNERLIRECEAENGPLTADDIPWGGQ